MRKFILSVLVLSVIPFSMLAQQRAGVWSTVAVDKKIHEKWNLRAKAELRTFGGADVDLVNKVERWTVGATVGYSPLKALELSTTYILMNVLDREYNNYQFQHRFFLTALGRQSWGNFSFSLRERLQITTRDDSKRIKPDGSIDAYEINTDVVWRNRLHLTYNIPNLPIVPSASFETFYILNHPEKNKFNEIRYILSLGYKINPKNTVELYGMYRQNPSNSSIKDAYGIYILGLSYRIGL